MAPTSQSQDRGLPGGGMFLGCVEAINDYIEADCLYLTADSQIYTHSHLTYGLCLWQCSYDSLLLLIATKLRLGGSGSGYIILSIQLCFAGVQSPEGNSITQSTRITLYCVSNVLQEKDFMVSFLFVGDL